MTNSTETDTKPMESKEEKTVDPTELVAQGKRNLLCREIPKAVNVLQEACSILAEKYGEIEPECGEAYYLYGSSLLELSRMESGVLGNALDGVPDEEDSKENDGKDPQIVETKPEMTEEEKEKVSDEIIDAMVEKDEKKDGEKADEKMEEDKQDKPEDKQDKAEDKPEKMEEDKKEEKKTENGTTEENKDTESTDKSGDEKTAENGSENKEEKMEEDGDAEDGTEEEEGEEGETSQDEDKEKEEDVSNLQLAWEMLDLARVVYSKQDTKEAKLKVSDCHLKLGEVSMETDKYEEAVNDILECLKIQKEHLAADDRRLAETNYQLGLAYNLHKKYDNAVGAFKTAVQVLEDKIVKLTKIIEGDGEQKEKDEAKQEMEELKEIMPDVKSKIEDSEDEKKHFEKKQEEEGETSVGFGASSSGASTSSATPIATKPAAATEDKPASDISHLMRKKRKPEEDSAEEEQDVKKAKSENGSGDAQVNGHSNGSEANGNGDAETNGTNGSSNSPEKEKVIKTKTVEDVKAQSTDEAPAAEEGKAKEEVKA